MSFCLAPSLDKDACIACSPATSSCSLNAAVDNNEDDNEDDDVDDGTGIDVIGVIGTNIGE